MNQIISATKLLRHFTRIANILEQEPQALLIIQKRSDPLVLVNAGIFEELLAARYGADKEHLPGGVADVLKAEETLI